MSQSPNRSRAIKNFAVLTVAQVLRLPLMEWLIRNVLPRKGLAFVYGPSGSGKSLLVLDMCAAMVNGAAWFGNPVASDLRCLYVVLEGWEGVRQRVEAWQKFKGTALPDGVKFMLGSFCITDEDDVRRAVAAIEAAGGVEMVVIDTLNRAALGTDENGSGDAGKVIANAALLQNLTGALVVLVHHTGKDETRGMRGHSSLHAAADAIIGVKRNSEGERWWEMVKSKDGEDGASFMFELVQVEVGTDSFGLPLTSATIRETTDPAPSFGQKGALGKNQAVVYDEFCVLAASKFCVDAETYEPTPEGVNPGDLVSRCKHRINVSDNSRRTERANDSIKSLINAGYIEKRDGLLYQPR